MPSNPYPNIFDPGIAGMYSNRVPKVSTVQYIDNPDIRPPGYVSHRYIDNPDLRPGFGAEEQPIGATIYGVGTMAATVALAYHGYKRNNSVGWALVWGVFGGMFWPVAAPIALAQGFGEKRR